MNILELLEIGSVWLQNKTAIQLLVFQPFVDVERPTGTYIPPQIRFLRME
jgi:hypothetical protein